MKTSELSLTTSFELMRIFRVMDKQTFLEYIEDLNKRLTMLAEEYIESNMNCFQEQYNRLKEIHKLCEDVLKQRSTSEWS